MNKKVILALVCAVLTLAAWAQKPVSATEQKQIVEKIDKRALDIKTMQCAFTQTKKTKMLKKAITSSGSMYYKRSNKLRWQYSSPYNYTFVLNAGKAYIKSSKGTQEMDIQKNEVFRQISDIMINCITGGNLSKSSYFKVTVYRNGNAVYASLQPLKKELKQLYSSVLLYFNPALTTVTKVVMNEKNGDTTTIDLQNTKINSPIDDKIFSVR